MRSLINVSMLIIPMFSVYLEPHLPSMNGKSFEFDKESSQNFLINRPLNGHQETAQHILWRNSNDFRALLALL